MYRLCSAKDTVLRQTTGDNTRIICPANYDPGLRSGVSQLE